ncbi:MAG: hypothetical protein HY567_02605 [Candidatus Kerfeldbacteria bacterium]|nr:hypothetical protein [Candidatus Kerfeldbacteria bacterium]
MTHRPVETDNQCSECGCYCSAPICDVCAEIEGVDESFRLDDLRSKDSAAEAKELSRAKLAKLWQVRQKRRTR